MIGSDFNAERHELGVFEELTRAGWADWSEEPTCITANAERRRRIDRVWLCPEMQVRLLEVEALWSTGLKIDGLQQGIFRSGEPDKFKGWKLGDPGPEETEAGFTNEEFEQALEGSRAQWEAASVQGDVSGVLRLLDEAVAQRHSLHSPSFSKSLATTGQMAEEAKRD